MIETIDELKNEDGVLLWNSKNNREPDHGKEQKQTIENQQTSPHTFLVTAAAGPVVMLVDMQPRFMTRAAKERKFLSFFFLCYTASLFLADFLSSFPSCTTTCFTYVKAIVTGHKIVSPPVGRLFLFRVSLVVMTTTSVSNDKRRTCGKSASNGESRVVSLMLVNFATDSQTRTGAS